MFHDYRVFGLFGWPLAVGNVGGEADRVSGARTRWYSLRGGVSAAIRIPETDVARMRFC